MKGDLMSDESRAALGAEPAREGSGGAAPSVSRRALLIGVGSTAALLGLGSLRYFGSASLVRPPGGQDEVSLVSKCVHCYRCVEACPSKVIVPARLEHGVFNMQTPRLEFSECTPGNLDVMRYCDLCAEGNGGVPRCVQVCPTTALDLGARWSADDVVMGRAEIDPDLCIAYRSGHCAYCFDACAKARGEGKAAIYYRNAGDEQDHSTRLPVVDADKCNGCGACEAVCVSAQAGSTQNASVRAIVVKPLQD